MLKLFCLSLATFVTSCLLAAPHPYLLVYDDSITPGFKEKHLEALKEFKQVKEKTDYPASYAFFDMDNGHIPALHPVPGPDYHAFENESWEKHAKEFDGKFIAKNSLVYQKSISAQNYYLLELKPELSYQADFSYTELPYLVWQEFDIVATQPGNQQVIELLAELKKLDESVHSPLHYRDYSKQHGPHLPILMVMYFASDKADFDNAMIKTKSLRGEKGAALISKLNPLRQLLDETKGLFLPAISY